jgi:hypothetical protein
MSACAVDEVVSPSSWWVDRECAREIAGRLNVAHADLVT